MAQSEDKRKKLLYILQYLLEHTDENHIAKTPDIIEYLENTYEIEVERKTIYTDIKLIQDFGDEFNLEIVYDPTTKGYKVAQREFDLDELQLIIDCVQATKFITQRKVKELTDKLKRLTSRHSRPTLDKRRPYVADRIRNMNNSAFYGLDNIYAAIADDRKITFRYFNYNTQKEKEYNKRSYTTSPYALLLNDGNYYLLAFESGKMKHFRVDKMDNVKLTDEKRDGKEAARALNLSERSTKLFSMYGGKEEQITLRFSNHLTGVVIDRFGKDITMRPDGDKHFTIHVAVEISPQFFGWLCGLGKAVKLVSPILVVEQFQDYVKGISGMYEADTEI
ncbi:WYL domain-containing protein [Oscillospiraceae bacterium OttesenSCG-928-F05]|nr:WYL domain-containing protein [Oscillospiraceae bacterium OttesenSCG-928-F05]